MNYHCVYYVKLLLSVCVFFSPFGSMFSRLFFFFQPSDVEYFVFISIQFYLLPKTKKTKRPGRKAITAQPRARNDHRITVFGISFQF